MQISRISLIAVLLISTPSFAAKFLIGGSGGVTGPIASLVDPWLKGSQDYCNYANETKVLGEDTVECVTLDDGFKVEKFKENVEKLVDQNLLILVGAAPQFAAAVRNDLDEVGLPMLTGAPNLADATHRLSYQTVVSTSEQTLALLQYIGEEHKKTKRPGPAKVAVLYFQTGEAGKITRDHMKEAAAELGVEIIEEIPHTGAEIDFTAGLTRVQKNGAEYVLLLSIEYSASIIMKNIKQLNLLASKFGQKGKLSVTGTHYTGGNTFVALAGSIADGYVYASSLVPGGKLAQKLAKKYGREKLANDVSYATGITYMELAVAALKAAQKSGKVERKTIQEAFDSMNGNNAFQPSNAVAKVSYTKQNHQGSDMVQLFRLTKGKYVPMGKPFAPKAAAKIKERYTVKE